MSDPLTRPAGQAPPGELLALGRNAYAARGWKDAYGHLSRADEQSPLDAEDLERLALAAYAIDLGTESARAWTRAHHEWLKRGELQAAARTAFQQACALFARGEMAPAQGWIARGRRIVDDVREECAEHGWLLELTGLPHMFQGEDERALPYFTRANEIAERFDDKELLATTRQTLGHTLVQLNRIAEGLALVDEAMVAVTSGEVNPLFAGIAYCQLIQTCQGIFDLRRAREWTASLSRWCDAQPDLVPYRGDCLVYRSEMFVLLGAWPDAEATAAQACETLAAQRAWATLGSAHYQLAEICRLRGDFESAEAQYRRATDYGRDPEPGLSLLRLALRRADAARSGIERALHETARPASRARLLPAYIEVMLSAGEVGAAERAATELEAVARDMDTPLLRATSAFARGSIMLARDEHGAALGLLREACREFQGIDAPYGSARARVLIAIARRALGDGDGAAQDFAAARSAFDSLGATADVQRVDDVRRAEQRAPGGLSPRELEVLVLVARGLTNRQISAELVLSQNTVARHVQNIFTKLGVSSRTAATAFAFEHRLL